ncbi:MAG: VOC family protein [Dehalococcoidia bacterium]|nr:VOC family protein [Dehalococcoidia bacterium]
MKKKNRGELFSRPHHLAVIVKDMDEAIEYYQALGMGPFEPVKVVHTDRMLYGKPAPSDIKLIARGGQMGPIWLELIQPVSGKYIHNEFLERRGEGINHMSFLVDDIEEAISIMAEAGFEAIVYQKNVGGGGMAFFDTDKIGGVIIELQELPLGVDRYYGSTTSNK